MNQITRTYTSEEDFKRDADNLAKHGWHIVSQSTHKEDYDWGKGCCLGVLFLPLMLLGKGKNSIMVTYEHRGKLDTNTKT